MTNLESRLTQIRLARVWLWPCCIWWTIMGAGTMVHLAGHPTDAPHMHLSDESRGFMWITTGVLGLIILAWDRKQREMPTRLVAALLLMMPLMRAVSYTWAYIVSLGDKDDSASLKPWYLEGSPSGWYTCVPWWIISWAILSQAVDWRHLWRTVRGGRR